MRWIAYILLAISSGPMLGCGRTDTGPTADAKPGPGGGTMFPLPNGKGYVEIKSEIHTPARNARGASRTSTIIAMFVQPDGTTELSPAPTEVSARLGTDESNKTVALNPSPGEPRSSSRFATAQGDYPENPRGVLAAKIGGDSVEVPFSVR